jgi:hypothetical protein
MLDAYPWKLADYDNQLWKVVDGSFPSVVQTVPQPGATAQTPVTYSGSNNYVLANGSKCAPLTGVRVTICFTEDLLVAYTTEPNHPAFSIQVNAETAFGQPLDWLQFMTHMGSDQNLWPWINIWFPDPGPTPVWLQTVNTPLEVMPSPQSIPAGYSIVVALNNDDYGNVAQGTWTVNYTSQQGTSSTGPRGYALVNTAGGAVEPGQLCPMASFQVTFGGAMDSAFTYFDKGAGVIIYEADQPMTVYNNDSWPGCIGYTNGTGESSNMLYGPLEAITSTKFTQSFRTASLLGGETEQLQSRLRKVNPNARATPVRPGF